MRKFSTLVVVGIIMYLLFQNNRIFFTSNNQTPVTVPKEQTSKEQSADLAWADLDGNLLEKSLSKVMMNLLKTEEGRLFIKNIVTPMNQPTILPGDKYKASKIDLVESIFKISTLGEGDRDYCALCGDLVTIRYRVLTMSNAQISDSTTTFHLGNSEEYTGLSAVTVGMNTGQTRHATVIEPLASNDQNQSKEGYKLYIELQNIALKNPWVSKMKVFDDVTAYVLPVLCGQIVEFDARITRLATGEMIYDSQAKEKKLTTVVGNTTYPKVVSYALHNKMPIGTRTVIAPGELFKSHTSNHSTFFSNKILPKDEYFMLELFNVQVIKKPVKNNAAKAQPQAEHKTQ